MAAALLLSACAGKQAQVAAPAPASAYYQSVHVNTPGVVGAQCTLDTVSGSYRIAAPGSITIQRTSHPMTVTCEKGEHFRGMQTVQPRKVWERENVMAYMYPFNVSVAMGIGRESFRKDVTVF